MTRRDTIYRHKSNTINNSTTIITLVQHKTLIITRPNTEECFSDCGILITYEKDINLLFSVVKSCTSKRKKKSHLMKLEMFENIVSLRSVALKTPIYIYSDPYSKQNKSKKKSERVF